MKFRTSFLSACLMLWWISLPLQAAEFHLEDIAAGNYRTHSPARMHSMNDGTSYAQLSDNRQLILRYDYKTGKLLDTLLNVATTRTERIEGIEGFCFNAQESKLLVWNNSRAIYRRSFYADYYVYDRHHNLLEKLSEQGQQRDASFSPDGRMVAFARDNNLFIKKLDFKTEVAVTTDGQANCIINGVSDWLYEEEFATTKMYVWTADSRYLCYVKFDERKVKEYTMPLYHCNMDKYEAYRYYPGESRFKYPRAGEDNALVSLHAYQVQYRQNTHLNLPTESDDYLPFLIETKQSNRFAIVCLNRLQNQFKLFYVNPKSNLHSLVLSETNEAYIDPSYLSQIEFSSKDFTYISERDGFRHLYLYKLNGTLSTQLTHGQEELIHYYGRDTLKNLFYYQTVDKMPYRRAIFCSDIKGKRTKLGKGDGVFTAQFDRFFRYYVEGFSTANQATTYSLCDAKGKALRALDDQAELKQRLQDLPKIEKEFFETPAADGTTQLYGWMMKPLGFDENQTYPLLLIQYSGPDSQEALDEFSIGWEYFLAQQGYVVACVDGRGTGGRGQAFRKSTYMQLGKLESADQCEVARALGCRPYIDASRMAIWGWSYGGFVSLLCLTQATPLFKAGIAIAPVTDYRYYNTAYTERFMRRPQENPDGYQSESPLLRADQLNGKLLLVHGIADDNVHVNQSMELIDALVRQGKQFEMQFYPNRNHSILGKEYRQHLYQRWWLFLQQNM